MLKNLSKTLQILTLSAALGLGAGSTTAFAANSTGFIDSAQVSSACNTSNLILSGWAKNANSQVNVLVRWLGQDKYSMPANTSRPDAGGNFGYNINLPLTAAESQAIIANRNILEVYAINSSNQRTRLNPSNPNYFTAASSACPNNSGGGGTNPNVNNSPNPLLPVARTQKWNGNTKVYNWATRSWVGNGADQTRLGFRDIACNTVDSGVYSSGCNVAANLAGNNTLYAFRYKYIMDISNLSAADKQNYFTRLGITGRSNATKITFDQQAYTYYNQNARTYVDWFYIRQGNTYAMSTNNTNFWVITAS